MPHYGLSAIWVVCPNATLAWCTHGQLVPTLHGSQPTSASDNMAPRKNTNRHPSSLRFRDWPGRYMYNTQRITINVNWMHIRSKWFQIGWTQFANLCSENRPQVCLSVCVSLCFDLTLRKWVILPRNYIMQLHTHFDMEHLQQLARMAHVW